MGRYIDLHKKRETIKVDETQMAKLAQYLSVELEDALSSRQSLESTWRELLRQYEGVPKNPVKDFPIENAPNIEVTLGAIACDSIYAQVVDLIYQVDPFITCRPVPKGRYSEEQYCGQECRASFRFLLRILRLLRTFLAFVWMRCVCRMHLTTRLREKIRPRFLAICLGTLRK